MNLIKQSFLLASSFLFCSSLYAQLINSFPYNYAFENENQGSTSCGATYLMQEPGWSNGLSDDIDWTADAGGTGSTGTGPSIDQAPGSSSGRYMYTETSGCANDLAYLETPYFDFTSLAIPQIDFWYHMQGATMGTLALEAKTGANGVWSQVLAPFTDNLNAWQQQVVALGAYGNTDSVKIRFVAITGTSFTSDMAIDNVTVGTAPTCPQANSLNANNVLSTSADLSWVESGIASLWEVEYDLLGFTLGTGNTTLATSNTPFNLNGLNPNTDYSYYVRSLCSGHPIIISGVYDGPNSGGTPKGVELYIVDDIADLSVYGLSSANNGSGTTNSPEFSFPAVSVTAGSYLYISNEATQFTAFFGFAPDYTDNSMLINGDDAVELFYENTVIDVFGDVNQDGTGQAWEYLDGWALRNIGQTNNNGVFTTTNWTFSGINQLEGAATNSACTSPFPLGTFTSNSDRSPWIGPLNFTTACATITAPWIEDIESMPIGNTIDQNCWTETSGTYSWYTDNNGTGSSGTGPSSAYSGSNYFYTEASSGTTGNIADLISPILDLTPLTTPILSFYYHMYGATTDKLEIDIFDGSSWINAVDAIIGQQQTSNADAWRQRVVNLSAYASVSSLKVRFRATRGTSFTGDMAIDDIEIKDAPNVSLDAIDGLQSSYCNAPIAVNLIVSNNSSNVENDVPWFIESNGSIINSGSINSIGPNSTDTVPVVIGIFPSNPNADIIAYTSLATDFTSSDDTISTSIQVSYTALNATMTAAVGCLGDSSGVILAEGSGGLGQYSYLWGNNASNQTLNQVTGLSANTYSVSATDTTGCTAVATLVLLDPPTALSVVDSTVNVACYGENSATISAFANGGVAGYNYAWSNGTNSNINNNIAAGNYTLTITDAYGCMLINSYNITEPTASLSLNLTDNGNGSITAAATGGQSGYSYLWNSLAGSQTSSTATGLSSGTYTVLVTDANGCTAFASLDIIVTEIQKLDLFNAIQLYPNPTAGQTFLQVNAPNIDKIVLQITDLSGKEINKNVYSLSASSTVVLATENLSAGMYIVNFELNNQVFSKKLIRLD